MVDPATFRDVMAQWPSGVTVVTTLVDGVRHGMTASSFSSVSLDPPLISVCLDKRLYSHELISRGGVFGVNVLAKDQAEVARRFAGMVPGLEVEDRFDGESWTTAATGVSLLDSALGWLDCRVLHEYPGGDHTIFVGEVLAGHAARRTAPLLFHSRGWGQFADVLPDVATLADSGLVAALRRQQHPEDGVLQTARDVATSGVRVRVLDLTDHEGDPVAVPEPLAAGATALVATRRPSWSGRSPSTSTRSRSRSTPPGPVRCRRRSRSSTASPTAWPSCSTTRSRRTAPRRCCPRWWPSRRPASARSGWPTATAPRPPLQVRAVLQDARRAGPAGAAAGVLR